MAIELLRAYRRRVRRRPDSEHNQALLRVVIVCLLLADTAWIGHRNPTGAGRLWAINIFATVFSVLLFARIIQRPEASPRRRIAGAVHDNTLATAWLYTAGPSGALALFVFPFVTVGNGFRFGVKYLAWSGFLGAIGIATLVVTAPGWTTFRVIGYGVLLSHVVVTVYTGILLNRLRQTQDQLERLATSDLLTGLPNRRFFMDRLSHIVAALDHPQLACLYLDLDGFKAVNDRWGHKVGDQLLHRVARELVGCIGAFDTLARLGGDEFTLLLDGRSSADDATAMAGRIIGAVHEITDIDGSAVDVSVSIGISFVAAGASGGSVTSDELIKAADDAMYVAKRSGRGRSHLVHLPGDAL